MNAVWRRLLRDRTAVFALTVLSGLFVVALTAAWLSPTDPLAQPDVIRLRFIAPLHAGPDGTRYWLGTDGFGRDLLSRLIYGSRISLTVGFLSVALAVLIGGCIGVLAAVLGRGWDRALMALTDAALALPRLVLLLALVALFEPSLWLVIVVLGLTGWMTIARLSRAECRKVLSLDYVTAARAGGASVGSLVVRHVLPNVLTPIAIAAALGIGNAITLESGLAFLGLGVPPPAPSWGNMIAGGRDALVNAPWIAGFPGGAIVLVVVATNLLGDALRDALDPHRRSGQNMTVTTSRG